jgi:hypothetical protein
MNKTCRSLILFSLVMLGPALYAEGFVELEAAGAFAGYNDVRIPSDTGTDFSLAKDTPSPGTLAFRARGGYTFAGRHTVMALVAPLTVRGSGTLDRDIVFQGHTFSKDTKVDSSYRFDSYRLTYRYTFLKTAALDLAAGLTGKIRSADIALMSDDGATTAYAHRSDLGAVPLINLMAEWRPGGQFSLLFDADALVTPFGRAEDLLAALQYRVSNRAMLRLGYRVLEGGSDGGGKVYTFALFHYLAAGLRVSF